ncbi:MAG: putative 4-hydroxybenzoate polyprenyltransferase [Spirochaetota bacterium]|nr:putative 4-hydroxybenzoate polyprenyltransferase [Spirochaetota bacterium]
MKKIANILRMIKFSHTIFAFPFAIVSIIINKQQEISVEKIFYISIALVFARSSAMAFNRLVDYKYDKENPRTQNRELVTGKLKKREVIIFMILCSIGFIGISFLINFLCFVLSPIVLIVICSYSYWKRFSILIGLAPIGVDVALNETVSYSSILLFLAITFWIFGFDIIYSLLDIDFDKKVKLFSLPSRIGAKKALIISRITYILMMLSLITLGFINHFGVIYYIGLFSISILLVTQHIWVKPKDFSCVNKAFFDLNSIISLTFLGIVILEIIF